MNTQTCLILAAGKGARIAHRTDSKPLLELHGFALIEHIMLNMREVGLQHSYVVSGYNGEKLRAFLDQLACREKIEIRHVINDEWHKGNGLSVYKAKDLLMSPFFLLMGDHVFDARIVEEMNQMRFRDGEIVLAVDYNLQSPYVDLDDVTRVATEDGLIVDIGKKKSDYNAYDTGIFLCSPVIFESLEDSMARYQDDSLSGGIRCLAQTAKAVRAFDIQGKFWVDIDDENTFLKVSRSKEIRSYLKKAILSADGQYP